MSRNDSRRLAELKHQCVSARNIIADLFLNNIVRPNDDPRIAAWGQYLDLQKRRLSRQYGIYGTTAGIQVLSKHDSQVHRQVVATSLRILPFHVAEEMNADDQQVRDYFVRKGDLAVVYKVAALVDAIDPQVSGLSVDHPAIEHLLRMRLAGGGWSDFRYAESETFHGPKVHATASALLALARFANIRERPDWREASAWLARNIEPNDLSIATLSMSYMALLVTSREAADTPSSVVAARDACFKTILRWARRTAAEDVRRTLEATEYLVPVPGSELPLDNRRHNFTFLLYAPHCLAALALMNSENPLPPPARRFVMDVVSVVVKRVCDQGSFIAAGRKVVSSVEHLWIYRLLDHFEGWKPYVGPMAIVTDTAWRLLQPARWVTAGALSLTLWVLLAQSSTLPVTIALTAVTTVVLTVISTLVLNKIFES